MQKNETRYLAGNSITMADIGFASIVFKLVTNENYENCHIMQAVLGKFPKLVQYVEVIKVDFQDYLNYQIKSVM